MPNQSRRAEDSYRIRCPDNTPASHHPAYNSPQSLASFSFRFCRDEQFKFPFDCDAALVQPTGYFLRMSILGCGHIVANLKQKYLAYDNAWKTWGSRLTSLSDYLEILYEYYSSKICATNICRCFVCICIFKPDDV